MSHESNTMSHRSHVSLVGDKIVSNDVDSKSKDKLHGRETNSMVPIICAYVTRIRTVPHFGAISVIDFSFNVYPII